MDDYIEARHLKILRPQLAPPGKSYDQWISSTSPVWQRLAVVQLARYLCMECNYQQDLDEHKTTWESLKIQTFSLTADITQKDGTERQGLIGIATFITNNPKEINLYHCYVHPFFRKKGILATRWSEIKKVYPTFYVEQPVSPAFQAFLEKHQK